MTFWVWLIASVGISAVLPAAGVMVGVAGFEPAISSSQAKRVTSFPTPRDGASRAWKCGEGRAGFATTGLFFGDREPGIHSGDGNRTRDLKVMSLPSYRCSTPHDRILPQVGVENSEKHTRSERTGNQALAALILMWSGPQDVAFYYNRNPQVTCFQQNRQQVDIMLVIPKWEGRDPLVENVKVTLHVSVLPQQAQYLIRRQGIEDWTEKKHLQFIDLVGQFRALNNDPFLMWEHAPMVAQEHGPRNERSGCGALNTSSIDPYYPCSNTEKHQCQGEHQPAITRRTIACRFRKVHMAQIQSAAASTVISKDCFITVCLCLRDAQSIGTVTTKPQQSYPSTKVLKWL